MDDVREISCVVVAISGGQSLARCVRALRRQITSRTLEIVVSAPATIELPALDESEKVTLRVVRSDTDSPVDLAAAGVNAATGSIVLLTEDHCIPCERWTAMLSDALGNTSVTAAGGPLLPHAGMTAFDWAFFLVDFFRYIPPVKTGQARSLSVCNVGYRASTLAAFSAEWERGFHETRVHGLLRNSGKLLMVPAAEVRTSRQVAAAAGIAERYRFGRLFAAERVRTRSAARLFYAIASPALPVLLLSRIARRCAANPPLARRFLITFPYLAALVVAWSLGELVGYVTGMPPASLVAAANRADAAQLDFIEA